MSKALDEVRDDPPLRLRRPVAGSATDWHPGLWERLVRQPENAVVSGFWTLEQDGCASGRPGQLVLDLLPIASFEAVHVAKRVCHFTSKGSATKCGVLASLAGGLRPISLSERGQEGRRRLVPTPRLLARRTRCIRIPGAGGRRSAPRSRDQLGASCTSGPVAA